jgi:DNA mismatch endonuclease (patch repair protein)
MENYLRSKLYGGRFHQVTPQRSRIMSSIRGKSNKSTEGILRMALVRAGMKGWQLHANLPGRPDFYFPSSRTAIFVDGCFWHGCARCGHVPKTNRPFWAAKIARNRQRDRRNRRILVHEQISVLRFWEHDLRQSLARCVRIVQSHVEKGSLKKPLTCSL